MSIDTRSRGLKNCQDVRVDEFVVDTRSALGACYDTGLMSVAARIWAEKNEKAWSREPLTVDDVLASPMISEPLHRLDCCIVTTAAQQL